MKLPNRIYRNLFCKIAFIQLFLFHAFLDPFRLPDLPGYIETFDLVAENSLYFSLITGYVGVKVEPGWIIFCKLLSYISNNYQILLMATSIIIVGGYSITIRKYSTIVWLSFFLFLCTTYNQSLFVLRQHTAMAICLMSIPLIIERKIKFFVVVNLIALSFHYTAIVFYGLYFLYTIKLNRKFWLLFISITLIISISSKFLFNWLFANTWYNSYGEIEGSNYTNFFVSLCTLFLYLYCKQGNLVTVTKHEKCFVIMILLAIMISFVGVGFSPSNRLAKYFNIASIFLIPISLSKIKNTSMRSIIMIIIIIFYLLLFFSPSNMIHVEGYELL